MRKKDAFMNLEEYFDEEVYEDEFEEQDGDIIEEIEEDEESIKEDGSDFDPTIYYTEDKFSFRKKNKDKYEESYEEDIEEDYVDYEEIEEGSTSIFNMFSVLGFLSNWFIRIGVVIAIILLIYFFITGEVVTAILYILGLTVAFFFGYGFMCLLDRILSKVN